VWRGYSDGAGASCHESGEEDHECANATFCDWDENEADDCAADDTEADG
jgi:hypothetical protein